MSLHQTNLDSTVYGDLVDTSTAVASLVDSIVDLPSKPPSLYFDLEGINLSRDGSISILQLLILPSNETYLVDIHTLGDTAFSTPGASGQTLRGVLELESIPKVFFDIRNDSDALFSHFRVNLTGIVDLQLMELAARGSHRRLVNGLSRCIERDLNLTWQERQAWSQTKEKGKRLFAPERGGNYEVFNSRPLSYDIRTYCIQDVLYMPKLWVLYNSKLTLEWERRVQQATKDRVASSQARNYVAHGKDKALAPAGWA